MSLEKKCLNCRGEMITHIYIHDGWRCSKCGFRMIIDEDGKLFSYRKVKDDWVDVDKGCLLILG